MDWFLYDRDLRLKRVKDLLTLRRQEYLGLHQKSIIEIFCKNSERFFSHQLFLQKSSITNVSQYPKYVYDFCHIFSVKQLGDKSGFTICINLIYFKKHYLAH